MADFNIRVKVDPRDAIAGTGRVNRSLEGVQARAQRLQAVMARTFAAVGIAAGVGATISTLADFGQTLSTVRGITEATDSQFVALQNTAKELGATTRFTASQAGEGLLFLARAGFSVEQSIDTVDDALNLAQAGALGLGRAADIATNVLTGFRLQTDQAGRVVDVLAKAANSANTDVDQLGQAIKFVGPVAAGVNVELETATAAISALSNAGLQASLAGTGLRRVLSELESPSSKTAAILEKVGLTVDQVRVSNVGLVTALTRLRDAGVDTGQALEIFGDRGGPAFAVLSSSIPDVIRLEEKLLKADGTAKRIARTMDDNLNGALLAAKSAFEAVTLATGALGVDSSLTGFFRNTAVALRGLAANLDIVQKGIEGLAFVLTVTFAQKALTAANTQLLRFVGVIAANPLAPFLIALGALTVAMIAFRDEISLTEDGLITLGDFGQAAFELIQESLSALFAVSSTGFPQLQADGESAAKGTGAGFLGLVGTIANVLDRVIAFVFGLIDAIVFGFGRVPRAIEDVFNRSAQKVQEFVEDAINFVIEGINSLANFLGVQEIQLINFEDVENDAAGGLADLGRTLSDAFANQFELTTPFEDAINAALDRAAEISANRRNELGVQAPTGGSTIPGQPQIDTEAEPPAGAPGSNAFQKVLDDLRQEQQLLQLSAREYTIRSEVLQRAGEIEGGLNEAQLAQLESQVRLTESLREQANILDEIRGPQEALVAKQEALDALFARGAITAQEYADALAGIKNELNELNGIEPTGFERFKQSLEQTPDTTDALISGFNNLSNEISNFVATGKADIDSFVQNLLQQFTKILINQAILGLIGSFGGPAGAVANAVGGPQALGLPTFAQGGAFTVGGQGGTDSQVVAFGATPGERVSVETPSQQRREAPTPATSFGVTVVNVLDPKEILDAVASEEGEQVVINILSKNKDAIRRITA